MVELETTEPTPGAPMSAAYKLEAVEHDVFSSVKEQATAMERHLRSDEAMRATHAELEAYVTREGREYERRLMQAHLELRAAKERPVEVRGSDGVRRPHLRASGRPLLTVFGPVDVARLAYQAPGVEGLHPMDAELNLPEELYSHGLRRRAAEVVARCSYDEVVHDLAATTGAAVPKRQVEEMAIRAAKDFEAFYSACTSEPEPSNDNALVVMAFDGKGIAMRPRDLRAATQKAAANSTHKLQTRLSQGEKRNRKRMAEVAVIYTVEPFPRTAADILHDLKPVRDVSKKRPRPVNKQVSASVVVDTEKVIAETFQEAQRRDPEHVRRWVVLVDGNRDQIATVRKIAKSSGVEVTLVLDLIHVLEYVWKAAYCFHPSGSKEAETWVEQRLLGLLEGQSAGYVAKGMRQMATQRNLEAHERKAVDDCARYLVNNRTLLHYDRALRDGFPISTGVVEGACRYLVQDRMGKTGARWSLSGAEAVLKLRALWTNGDFEAYWAFHLHHEQERIHRSRYADGRVPCQVGTPKPQLRRVK
jgi:hypothetical protein